MKVANYILIVDILYRRHVIGVFLKYLRLKQALLVMFEVYERLYEAHQSKIKIRWWHDQRVDVLSQVQECHSNK